MINELNEEILKEVEHLASCLLSPEEIAIVTGLDPEEFQAALLEEGEISAAYYRGLLKTKAEVHAGIRKLAVAGSAPAQNLMLQLIKEAEMNKEKRI